MEPVIACGRHVLALDVGSTTVRSIVYDDRGAVVGQAATPVKYMQSQSQCESQEKSDGRSEMDPLVIWEDALSVVKSSLTDAGLEAKDLAGLGLSCQRASFTCWSAVTGVPLHPLITWQDLRADRIVREWNRSVSFRALRAGGRLLHTITRQPRYLAAAIYKLKNGMVMPKLVWALQNVVGLREAAERGEVLFGCLDTWLLYKLTGRHLAEVSNIAVTGFYDPFIMGYASWAFSLFGIPSSIMPKVVASSGPHFGSSLPGVLGVPVPVLAVLADQSASFFGSGCHRSGSAKITMGTGSFLDVLTPSPHASINGLVPLVAWRIGEETAFLAEGSVYDTGGMVEWAGSLGLFEHVGESSALAAAASDTRGLYFVPGFHGLQGAVGDNTATAGFVGLRLDTTKAEMLRAVLESVAFSLQQLVEAFLEETDYKFDQLVVDGGVAQNDFILQTIADLTGLPVVRGDTVEMSAWGVAALAGIQAGLWKSREEVAGLRPKGRKFLRAGPAAGHRFARWEEACRRLQHWHPLN